MIMVKLTPALVTRFSSSFCSHIQCCRNKKVTFSLLSLFQGALKREREREKRHWDAFSHQMEMDTNFYRTCSTTNPSWMVFFQQSIKPGCDTRFQRAFTSCVCVFKVITLILKFPDFWHFCWFGDELWMFCFLITNRMLY